MAHIHFIGIGGSGLSAIARLLLESGQTVSGSDRVISPLAASLREAGAQVLQGHYPDHIAGADLVVRSSAIPDDNPEVIAARAAGIPVLKRSEVLGRLMEGRFGIAIAGTHGKTTTTAMIAWVLTTLGKDPSYIVGGVMKNLKANAHAGQGEAFVIEADEYDRMFLGLSPKIEVITSLEHDHPDCFPTREDYFQAFVEFTGRLQPGGTVIASVEEPGADRLLHLAETRGARTLAYAITVSADFQARNLAIAHTGGFAFDVFVRQPDGRQALLTSVKLQVPGEHNVLNALAALAALHVMGLPADQAAQALGEFQGTARRFDVQGEAQGITVIDDYAHHPSEIRATLAAARSRYPGRRLWAIWQPHTYSRTQSLFREFTQAFKAANRVIVTEIYAAREKGNGFSAVEVVKAMDHPGAAFIPTLGQVVDYLGQHTAAGDVVLVLSAGDADQVSQDLLKQLRKEGAA